MITVNCDVRVFSDFDTSDLICNTKHLGWLDRHHFYYILGIFQGDILVEGTKIKEVAEQISEDCLEDGDKLIEAEGYYVLPGLIDEHSHIGLFDFNVDPCVDDANEMTNPVTLSVDARFGTNPKAREFKVAYEHGITTMLLTPGSGNVFCGLPFALILCHCIQNTIFD